MDVTTVGLYDDMGHTGTLDMGHTLSSPAEPEAHHTSPDELN